MTKAQYIKPNRRLCTWHSRIIKFGDIERIGGNAHIFANSWYDTLKHGDHINRLVGFSVDIFQNDTLDLGWRPAKKKGYIELHAYVRIGGYWCPQMKREHDMIDVVGPGEAIHFDISHYMPETEYPEDYRHSHREARFAVNGKVVIRSFGVPPGSGWIRNLRYGKDGGINQPITSMLDFQIKPIE